MPLTRSRNFRFIDSGTNSGPVNMAIDEAVMTGLKEGWSQPLLRLYRWSPPTISIGYFQSLDDIDTERCAHDGIGVVRRLTGGRAVLHHEEVTYSVLFGESDFVPFRKREIFIFVARCLIDSLELLGVSSTIAEKTRGSLKSPNCFAAPAQYEIESAGAGKLVGSAQVIRDGVVLQHGAIPLSGSYMEISRYLKGQGHSFKSASHLNEVSGRTAAATDLVECLRQGFGTRLPLEDGTLNEREAQVAAGLAEKKYSSRDWLDRK